MKTMQLADLHDYGAMEEGEKEFIQVKGFGIDFDVRMPLHYTVIIIKRKSLYFIFIKMFNYLSNCYFETKNNAFQIGCFYPAFACTGVCTDIYNVVCVCFFCSHGDRRSGKYTLLRLLRLVEKFSAC